jgi:ABC-type multidrug transport system permease subunit
VPSATAGRLSQALLPPGFGPPEYNPQTGQYTTPAEYQAHYDATMQERFLWWTVRIVVVVFVLIALVLAAESV